MGKKRKVDLFLGTGFSPCRVEDERMREKEKKSFINIRRHFSIISQFICSTPFDENDIFVWFNFTEMRACVRIEFETSRFGFSPFPIPFFLYTQIMHDDGMCLEGETSAKRVMKRILCSQPLGIWFIFATWMLTTFDSFFSCEKRNELCSVFK